MTEATEQQQHINSYIFKDSNTSIYLDYMLYVCVCVCVCVYAYIHKHIHLRVSLDHIFIPNNLVATVW